VSTCAHAGVRFASFFLKFYKFSQISSSCWILNWDLCENAVFATNISEQSFIRDCMLVIVNDTVLIFLRSPPVIWVPHTLIVSPHYFLSYNNCNNKIGKIGFLKKIKERINFSLHLSISGRNEKMKMWFKTSLLLRTINFHLKCLFLCWISHFGSF